MILPLIGSNYAAKIQTKEYGLLGFTDENGLDANMIRRASGSKC